VASFVATKVVFGALDFRAYGNSAFVILESWKKVLLESKKRKDMGRVEEFGEAWTRSSLSC